MCILNMELNAIIRTVVIWNVFQGYIAHICHENPYARIRDPQHCGQFYDCSISVSQHYVDYLMECPYPKMFSDVSRACEEYTMVDCLGRMEPKEPCDYLQYRQMYDCHGFPGNLSPGCNTCRSHHPSCTELGDGTHPVTTSVGYPIFDLTMDCHRGRTLRIHQELRVDRPVTRVTKAPVEPEVMKLDVLKTKTQGRPISEPIMNKNVKS